MRSTAAILALGILLAACGASPETDGTSDDVSSPPETSTTTQPNSSTTAGKDRDDQVVVDELVEVAVNARTQLAADLETAEGNLKLISSEPVTWRDGSIGCPEPGQSYPEALVEGYLIVFEYDGERYEVHQARNAQPILCLEPATDAFIPPTKKTPEISIPPPIR